MNEYKVLTKAYVCDRVRQGAAKKIVLPKLECLSTGISGYLGRSILIPVPDVGLSYGMFLKAKKNEKGLRQQVSFGEERSDGV